MFNSWNLEAAVAESYKEVIKKFEETLRQIAINFYVACLQLHFMHQDRGETLDSFVTRCRTQAVKCELEAGELEARIIEQIIASTQIQKFQRELLGKGNNLTLEQAIELGRKHEAALFSAERLREMATGSTAISIDTMNRRRGPQNNPSVRTVVETMHEDEKPAQHTNPNAMVVGALVTGRISVSTPKLNNEDKPAKTEMDQISGTGAGHNQDQDEDHTSQ